MEYVVSAFYKFSSVAEPARVQPELKRLMLEHDVKGTVLLAPEGINGTISGLRAGTNAVMGYLRALPGMSGLEAKESFFSSHAFERSKVKLKKEVISLGEKVDPNGKVGVYVPPAEWNELISDPEVMTIDARNDYEVAIGSFEGAVNPKTTKFRELPGFVRGALNPAKHRKIATYCTGGIRCEKFSSWLLDMGFEEVYHLQGGILKYLEEIPPEESKWQGSCYVFDERVGLEHGLSPSPDVRMCRACGHPLFTKDRIKPEYEHGVSCSYCDSSEQK